MSLKRFWFTFASMPPYDPLRLGCGVSAYNYADALSILEKTVFGGKQLPRIGSVVEDVQVSDLDQKHVVPNMDPVVWRGVWFPKGYPLPDP